MIKLYCLQTTLWGGLNCQLASALKIGKTVEQAKFVTWRLLLVSYRVAEVNFVLQSEPEESTEEPTTSRNTNLEVEEPLPPGWATAVAPNGRVFYIDHNTKATTWV